MEVVRLIALCLLAACVIAQDDDCDMCSGPWVNLGPEECDEADHDLFLRQTMDCDESLSCGAFRCCKGSCDDETAPGNMEIEPTTFWTSPPLYATPPADSAKTCVSDCSKKSDWVKSYDWLSGSDELCENELTKAVTGRGGEGCEVDPWFVIEKCDESCYKFVWRGTYPLQCDVEDRYLWCCPPVVTTPDTTTGAQCDGKVECHVTTDPAVIDDIVITWLDAEGNDLSYVSTFDIDTATVDDDKVASVLRVEAGSMSAGQHVMTCQVSDGVTVLSSEAVVRVFSVSAEGAVEYIDNAPADLVCVAAGADFDDFAYEVFWYTEVDGIEVEVGVGGEGYSTTIFAVEGGLGSKLTVAPEYQTIGDTVFTCKVQYTSSDACSSEVCTEEAEATLSIIDVAVSPTDFCAHVNEEAVVSFVVVGSDVSWPRESVVFDGADGTSYSSDPSDVHRITWVANEDGDMVATLILDPSLQDTVETRVYAGSAVYKEFRVDVPIFLHVMDLKPADEGVAPVQIDTDQGTLLTVVVSGGTLANPVWSDEEGNTFGVNDVPEGYVVTVSPDNTETYLQISPDQLTKIGTKVYTVVVDLYAPTATEDDEPCQQGVAQVTLDTFQCHMVYEPRSCDPDRQTCSTTQIMRPGTCVCDEGYSGTCDEIAEIPVSCPPTLSFEVTDWSPEVCNEEKCYAYASPQPKTRDCVCGGEVDNTKCGGVALATFYICPGTKPWTMTPWSDMLCPSDPCFPAQSQITRECVCDGFSDSDRCDGDTEATVDCPVEPFAWSEWEVKDCSNTGCYDTTNVRYRSCTCNSNTDLAQCQGDNVEEYVCEADKPWTKSPAGGSVCDTVNLCYDATLPQPIQCSCDGEVDASKCEGAYEEPVFCPASKNFELTEWEAVNECAPCFPEIPQTKKRSCTCDGIIDVTGEQCQAALTITEKCPATGEWHFSEWSAEPCQESCKEVVKTDRSRSCVCEGNLDNTRCVGPLTDVVDCKLTPFTWSEWSERKCPNVCYSATTKRYRVCSCLGDIDFSQCTGLSLEFRPCEVPDSCFT